MNADRDPLLGELVALGAHTGPGDPGFCGGHQLGALLHAGAHRAAPAASVSGSDAWGNAVPYYLRSPEEIAGFFEGLELVEPGVVSVPDGGPIWLPPTAHLSRWGQCGGVEREL